MGRGAAVLGEIAPALQVQVIVGMLTQTICQSLLPRIARDMEDGKSVKAWRLLNKAALGLTPVIALGIAIAAVIGPTLVDIVFGSEYQRAGQVLWIVSLSWSFRAYGLLYQNAILGQRNFKQALSLQAWIFIGFMVMIVPLTAFYGVEGALWGMVSGNALYGIVGYVAARRAFRAPTV